MKKTKVTLTSLKKENVKLSQALGAQVDANREYRNKVTEILKEVADIFYRQDSNRFYDTKKVTLEEVPGIVARLKIETDERRGAIDFTNAHDAEEKARLWHIIRVATNDPTLQSEDSLTPFKDYGARRDNRTM